MRECSASDSAGESATGYNHCIFSSSLSSSLALLILYSSHPFRYRMAHVLYARSLIILSRASPPVINYCCSITAVLIIMEEKAERVNEVMHIISCVLSLTKARLWLLRRKQFWRKRKLFSPSCSPCCFY